MYKFGSITSHLSLRDKMFALDLYVVFGVFILGIISCFAMYSTDAGTFSYHTKSHIVRFFVFFTLFFFISFTRISFWYNSTTIIYISFFLLLVLVKYFGLTSSGSKRWLGLYFLNLHTSELMIKGLILVLAKYYQKI